MLLVRRALHWTGPLGNGCPASAYSTVSMKSVTPRGVEEGRWMFILVVRAVLAPEK